MFHPVPRVRSDRAIQSRRPSARCPGSPRADIQRQAHRRVQEGAEKKFLERVRLQTIATCALKKKFVKLHGDFSVPPLNIEQDM